MVQLHSERINSRWEPVLPYMSDDEAEGFQDLLRFYSPQGVIRKASTYFRAGGQRRIRSVMSGKDPRNTDYRLVGLAFSVHREQPHLMISRNEQVDDSQSSSVCPSRASGLPSATSGIHPCQA